MSDFDQLIHDIEQEAITEGPEAVAALRSLDSQLHIAGQLLALRHRRGLTQRQLSELSGIQQADISRIECGETHPTTVTAKRPRRRARRRLRLLRNQHHRQDRPRPARLSQSGVASWPTTAQSSGRRRPGTR